MFPTHRHADGGLYQYLGPQKGKSNEWADEWVDGVAYRNEEGMLFWTNDDRWHHRFEPIPLRKEPVEVQIDEDTVTRYYFTTADVGDVRHLLISAADAAGKRYKHIESVLVAQAEMVMKGLHVRDLEEIPDLMGDVNRFHQFFGQEYQGKPRILPEDLHEFRTKFHDEETSEYAEEYPTLVDALAREDHREVVNSLELQLDALCDAVWVVLGTADLQFTKPVFYAAWRRVVKANMAKVRKDQAGEDAADSGRQPKYDIVKPAGWLPPDHRDLVQDYEGKIFRAPGALNPDHQRDTMTIPPATTQANN